uniref:Uncharacterized protein n=1 Tax=Hyaloperonospora arabidopsidis (strain Emoy2) TaxID=559515 RepID=M4B317_HYAAE
MFISQFPLHGCARPPPCRRSRGGGSAAGGLRSQPPVVGADGTGKMNSLPARTL